MIKHRSNPNVSRLEAGFSLIELAIVMIIISLITAPLLQEYKRYAYKKRDDETKINMFTVNNALGDYYARTGAYPCPADRTLQPGDAGFGESRCTQLQALGPNSCNANNGLCRPSDGGAFVMLGGVPYVTLEIPYATAIDGWKDLLTYAVSEVLTDNTTFLSSAGAVEIIDENGVVSPNRVHGIIVSHGANGSGAFGLNGVEKPCDATRAESENCDNNLRFLTSLYSGGDNAQYYDDIVLPSDWSQSSIWTYSDINRNDIFNTNTGNVGVGTETPQFKLDVTGDIKADATQSTEICSGPATDCFSPETIGGAGIQCPGGRVLVGIANDAPICASVPMPNITGVCAPGEFIVSITNGVVNCAAP